MKELYVKDGNLFITPDCAQDAEIIVENVLKLSQKSNIKNVKMDLTNLNMFDALKVATLTSARGLTENLNNRYEVIVNNSVVKSQINILSLSNLNVTIENSKQNNVLSKGNFAF